MLRPIVEENRRPLWDDDFGLTAARWSFSGRTDTHGDEMRRIVEYFDSPDDE